MNFKFLSGMFSKVVDFAVTKPLMAFAISTATLTGATVTGIVVHDIVQNNDDTLAVEKNEKDTSPKKYTNNKNDNKDNETQTDKISNEEIDELLENENKDDETNDDNSNDNSEHKESDGSKESTSMIASSNTSSSTSKGNTSSASNKGNTSSSTSSNKGNTSNNTANSNTNKPSSSNTVTQNPGTTNSGSTNNGVSNSGATNNGATNNSVSKPSRPSGIDNSLSQQCYAAVASPTANPLYPDIRNILDNMVDDLIFNQHASGEAVKSALANYKYKGYKIVYKTQFNEVILPDGFAISDFKNQISKVVTDNYLYVKVYWNANTNKYHAYYIASILSYDVISEANTYPLE